MKIENIEDYKELVVTSYEEGNLEEAFSICQKAIQIQPDSFFFYELLIDILISKEQKLEASKYKSLLGDLHQADRQCHKAIELYRDALELNPASEEAYEKLSESIVKAAAQTYQELGRFFDKNQNYAKAITAYQRSLELNSSSSHTFLHLGDALRKQGKPEEAIVCYQEAIKLNPEFSPPFYRLKYTSINKEQLDGVIEVCHQAIQQKPDFSLGHYTLGNLITQAGNQKKAIYHYQQAIRTQLLNRNPDFLKKYCNEAESQGPNFIIIGTAKCGTTSLYNYITRHPLVLRAVDKEIFYFNQPLNRSIEWYKAHFPCLPKNTKYLTGEATPWYIYSTDAAQRIFNNFPNAKLLVTLRDPVERVISHYYHERKVGLENRTLDDVINFELEQLQSEAYIEETIKLRKRGYIVRSIYIFFIKKWMEIFPKENILLIDIHNLHSQPMKVMNRVFEFLDLPKHTLQSHEKLNSGSYKAIDDALYSKLNYFFEPYNRELENHTGIKLSTMFNR